MRRFTQPSASVHARGLRHRATTTLAATLGAASLAAGIAHAGSPAQVEVQYLDPDTFTEFRHAGVGADRNQRGWLDALARHIAQRAGDRLPAGQQLTVVVKDLDRAGDYEPWRAGQSADVRIVRDVYPPSMDFEFTLLSADGTILRTGKTSLRDPAFMLRTNRYFDDPLRYEKAMIDDWVGQAFPGKG